ncbi:acyl-CoA dehydrogenase family protein [Knoellia subterranea]|uniref:Acyl-[acyl-carrier-protein] dehydrogenase MbtN n=1 Tax=Knoellia subterranea KCTC 19937 TaxID=1385521 RepID=A0A0A0JNN2_9MICO|nr:acyl-CoA dehydrogenase family protein [Knoellia subterranea]KGN37236.1 acyl-CoA dehydrogenase [Knoellia subterranea KCTC 19937]
MPEILPPATYVSPWMDGEDVADVAALARTFFAREVTPHLERFAEQHQVDRETWLAAGEAGLLCISVPEEYGGGGGTFAHEAAVLWEQGRAGDDAFGYSVHSSIVAHYLLAYGSTEQKQRWLPRMASGELVGAIAMTEPGTGSDLQAIRTTARREGDEYVINGGKTFITNSSHAGLIIIVARTGGEGAQGISLIVAEVDDLEGFERGRVLRKIGQHGQDTRELSFTDMRVPVANLLGESEGQGFYQLMLQLPQERLAIAVGAVASADLAVELALAYSKERQAFGKPISTFQNTRFTLAEVSTDVLAARTFLDHCVGLHVDGRLDAATASRAKYWTTDMQCEVIDRCLQVFGGYGYMLEYPIARLYAGARVQKIYGGTNEIMKELISRTL